MKIAVKSRIVRKANFPKVLVAHATVAWFGITIVAGPEGMRIPGTGSSLFEHDVVSIVSAFLNQLG